jgi:hypothetical protein
VAYFKDYGYLGKIRNPVTEDDPSIEIETGDIQNTTITETVAWRGNSGGPVSTSRLVCWIKVAVKVSEVKADILGEDTCFWKPFSWRVSLSAQDTHHFTHCLTCILSNYALRSRWLFALRAFYLYSLKCITRISISKPNTVRAFYRFRVSHVLYWPIYIYIGRLPYAHASDLYYFKINDRGNPLGWPRDTLYPQKLPLTSLTSGGRSVGIVRSRTKATEVFFYNISTYRPNSLRAFYRPILPYVQHINLYYSTIYIT